MTDDLKVVADAPSMVTVLDAVTQAQVLLAKSIEPADQPPDHEATVRKLLGILDDRKVVTAVDTTCQ